MAKSFVAGSILLVLLAACSETAPQGTAVAGRWYTVEQVELGGQLYQENCAVCHAADGSATADWRTADANGIYPPPPLNGTAHAWHHPREMLDFTIVNGGAEFDGVMPGFGALLDESERHAVVAWMQNLWSDEIYTNWKAIDERS